MDFLARFKGRTNFVTKEGICSIITEASTPIEKKNVTNAFGSPKLSSTFNKPVPQTESRLSSTSPVRGGRSPDRVFQAQPHSTLHESYENYPKNSSMMQLKIQTDPNFFGKKDKALHAPHSYYSTPQHKFFSPEDEPVSPDSQHSYRTAEMRQVSHSSGKPTVSQSQIYSNMYEQRGLKNMPENSAVHRSDSYNSALLRPAPRQNSVQNKEAQDTRLARMNFIERQEKVLMKYRSK